MALVVDLFDEVCFLIGRKIMLNHSVNFTMKEKPNKITLVFSSVSRCFSSNVEYFFDLIFVLSTNEIFVFREQLYVTYNTRSFLTFGEASMSRSESEPILVIRPSETV